MDFIQNQNTVEPNTVRSGQHEESVSTRFVCFYLTLSFVNRYVTAILILVLIVYKYVSLMWFKHFGAFVSFDQFFQADVKAVTHAKQPMS